MAVYKHGTKWMYDFWKNGMRYRNGGYDTKGEALDAEAKARATARKINLDFLKLCNSRLEDLQIRRTKGHFERNKKLFENLIVKWVTLKEITTEHVESYLKQIALVSKHKANKDLAWIKALFRHGIKKKLIDYDPTIGIDPFGVEHSRKYIPPETDIEAVLKTCTKEQWQYLIALIHTAARMREINKLKWDDVNLIENYVILRTRKAKNSDVAERKVPLTNTLKSILEGLPRESEYVFSHNGIRFDNRIKLIRSLCKRAKVKQFTFHNLRHYAASKMANAGVAITDIQEILGHTRTTTTDHYLQSIKGSVRQAIKTLEG